MNRRPRAKRIEPDSLIVWVAGTLLTGAFYALFLFCLFHK